MCREQNELPGQSQKPQDHTQPEKKPDHDTIPELEEDLPEHRIPSPIVSSGVKFHPPSNDYWRIGGEWYDLSRFAHPGGQKILLLARDRFEDATFAFEAHHHNYKKSRAILNKYKVTNTAVVKSIDAAMEQRKKEIFIQRKEADVDADDQQSDKELRTYDSDHDPPPNLLNDDAFYSVLRRRVTTHLKSIGNERGEPTWECIILFWLTFAIWLHFNKVLYDNGRYLHAFCFGLVSTILGAFGHNWIHQPKYKSWANLSLDLIGFSAEAWYREHVLQHHMYTNTPWDNHFKGVEPFLVTDPTVERSWLQSKVAPLIFPIIISFGAIGNYIIHTIFMLKGEEVLSPFKIAFPLQIAMLIHRWGIWHGLTLAYISTATTSIYYFTLALANHNSESCTNVRRRNKARDWGEQQLLSSTDFCTNLSFRQSSCMLWLNFHTVHHLFPLIDISHQPSIQKILVETCNEFDIEYESKSSLWDLLPEMITSFSAPSFLNEEILIYGMK